MTLIDGKAVVPSERLPLTYHPTNLGVLSHFNVSQFSWWSMASGSACDGGDSRAQTTGLRQQGSCRNSGTDDAVAKTGNATTRLIKRGLAKFALGGILQENQGLGLTGLKSQSVLRILVWRLTPGQW